MPAENSSKEQTYLRSQAVISSALSGNFPSSSMLDSLTTEEPDRPSENPEDLVKKRQMASLIHDMLTSNAILQKKQYNILDKIEQLAECFEAEGQASRQRFEQFELVDDLIEIYADLSDVQMAVMRGNAIRLSKYAPLEPLQQEDLLDIIPVLDEERQVKKYAAANVRRDDDLTVSPVLKLTTSIRNLLDDNDVIVPECLPPRIFGRVQPTVPRNSGQIQTEDAHQLVEEIDESNKVMTANDLMPGTSEEAKLSEAVVEPVPVVGDSSATSAEDSDSQGFEKSIVKKSESAKRVQSGKPGRKPVKKTVKKVAARRSTNRTPGKSSQTSTPEYEPLPKRSKRKTTEDKKYNRQNSQADSDVNPDEQIYCLCKEISYGQMICCDNSKCTIEWFHFGCVEITTNPAKGQKWYCPLCRGDKSTIMKR